MVIKNGMEPIKYDKRDICVMVLAIWWEAIKLPPDGLRVLRHHFLFEANTQR
jgi:hypothetical protein